MSYNVLAKWFHILMDGELMGISHMWTIQYMGSSHGLMIETIALIWNFHKRY